MATNNTQDFGYQMKFDGQMFLDPKMAPVASVSALEALPTNEQFKGAVRLVTNEGKLYYCTVDGGGKGKWKPVTGGASFEIIGD